jgi:RHS repeat-associated protein
LLSLYVDGERVEDTVVWASLPISNGPLRIGGSDLSPDRHLDGVIDEVRVYDGQLSEAEIEADMQTSVLAQASAGGTTATDGLVAAYGFGEGSGTAVADRSVEGNDGTISGAAWSASGRHGDALSFDGVDDYVEIPHDDSLDITGELTLSAWVKLDEVDTGRWQDIVFKERGSDGSYALDAERPAGPWPNFAVNDGSWDDVHAQSAIAADEWVHIAGVWEGEWLLLYVDGQIVEAEEGVDPLASTGVLRIGGTDVFGPNQHLDGLIDDVRVYRRPLSQHEIQTDMATSVEGQTAPYLGKPVPTVTYGYSATTGRQTTVTDSSGTITTGYDDLGRVTSYTDAEGNVSTTAYDNLNRPTETDDGKGTQSYDYDATTGMLTELEDSHAGTFTAAYDADGQLTSQTYPNGLQAETTYDEAGAPTRLTYTKTTNCASDCVWIDEQVTESIHGQWRTHSWELSSREYAYDGAGRLTEVIDDVHAPAAVEGCTIRSYAFDDNSNRTSLTTRDPDGNGDCQPTAQGTETTYSHDDADRLLGIGIDYDRFGRMTRIPGHHAGGGILTYTYYANDQVHTIAQDGISKTYALDATGRQRRTIPGNGTAHTSIMHYNDSTDAPAWTAVVDSQSQVASWTRDITAIGGNLAAIHASDDQQTETTTLQLSNLHGDIVATVANDSQATALSEEFETDEYGNRRAYVDGAYRWLGSKQRRTVLSSGVIQMGVRSYVPAIGRFTSTDPVLGGAATAYDYAYQDPVNLSDLDGRCVCIFKLWEDKFQDFTRNLGRRDNSRYTRLIAAFVVKAIKTYKETGGPRFYSSPDVIIGLEARKRGPGIALHKAHHGKPLHVQTYFRRKNHRTGKWKHTRKRDYRFNLSLTRGIKIVRIR